MSKYGKQLSFKKPSSLLMALLDMNHMDHVKMSKMNFTDNKVMILLHRVEQNKIGLFCTFSSGLSIIYSKLYFETLWWHLASFLLPVLEI